VCAVGQVTQLTQELLDCISAGDYATYQELCDERMTCFEPEAKGHAVDGMVRAPRARGRTPGHWAKGMRRGRLLLRGV
jgi:hypothetical protein